MQQTYEGPAGVVLTPADLLVIWKDLCRVPTGENAEIRRKIKEQLEHRHGKNEP